jgi:Domain of unknown function (DUF397)
MSLTKEELHLLGWRKASRSMGNGDCVEVVPADGKVLVRDSKIPHTPVLSYSVGAWESFVVGAKLGKLDALGSLRSSL